MQEPCKECRDPTWCFIILLDRKFFLIYEIFFLQYIQRLTTLSINWHCYICYSYLKNYMKESLNLRVLCFAGNMWHITLHAADHRISINEMLFIWSKLHYLYIHVTYICSTSFFIWNPNTYVSYHSDFIF